MTKTMKAAVAYDFKDIRLEEMPVPDVGPREALVKVSACGICSGDVMPWYIRKKAPIVLGHEPAGTIVEVGKEVKNFKVGDRVAIHHHAPCFTCRFCRQGDYVQCDTWRKTKIVPGGISEYVKIPEENLIGDTLLIPNNVSMEDATLTEPTACVVKGFKRARIKSGAVVLVQGLGTMGQLNVLLAKHYGAKMVIAADFQKFRCDYAGKMGADLVVNLTEQNLFDSVSKATGGMMADIIVVGPSSIKAMEEGIRCCGRGGTVLLFTPTSKEETLLINPHDIYFSEISIVPSYSCGPFDTREALELIEMGVVTAEKIVTHRFPLEQADEAFRITADAGDSIKTLVLM
ncbi:MAG: threonine dehydrogenase / Zn-dependent alcohol dehydrogenase [Deltaproteobacteria bacterium]|nr:threonine dehydrogenase / Zn-dependent alcohol dehydrogenase [Deltaproteobacteria bacterium]